MRSALYPLALGLVLVVVGLIALNGAIVAAALPLVLFASVRIISGASARQARIRVVRHLDRHRLTEGEAIEGTLEILNEGPPLPLAFIEDVLPSPMAVSEGVPRLLGRLPESERIELEYEIDAPRGSHRLREARVVTWTRFGLAMQETKIPLPDDVKVHPRYETLDPVTIRPRQTRAFAGPVKSNQGGTGLDFYGCRAYTPGDDVRRINWRAYARTGSLTINEYELERIADVNVILDARLSSHVRVGSETTFDHSVRAAAGMALHFLAQGNNVGLLIYGDHINWVFPGVGALQRERLLDSLMTAEPSDKAVFEDLRNIPTRLFPARSQLIFVSPEIDEDDTEVLALMLDRGYSVLLVSPHSTVPDAERLVLDPAAVELADRVTTLRRSLFLDALTRMGADVIDWEVHTPLRFAARLLHHSRVRRYR